MNQCFVLPSGILARADDLRSINHISLLSVKTKFNGRTRNPFPFAAEAGTEAMQTQKKAARQTIEPRDFLLPDPSLRRRPAATPIRTTLIEDAVFEVVSARPPVNRRVNDNPAPTRSARPLGVLPLLARLAGHIGAIAEHQLSRLSPQAFVALMASLAMTVFWLCGGFSAIGAGTVGTPPAPFAIVDTYIGSEDANGMKLVVVSGGVRNTAGRIIRAPRLAIVSGSHSEIIGTVKLSVDRIGPGVTIPFSGRYRLAGGKSEEIRIIPERL
jgi:hypothetical protein